MSEPSAEAKWHITIDEAFGQLTLWAQAVTETRRRIFDAKARPFTRQVDAQLFAIAVRQVLSFADLCRAIAPRKCRSAIDEAINAFMTTSPDAVSVRNVLDQWDAYLRGVGADIPGLPAENGIRERPTAIYYERGRGTYRLHITLAPRVRELILDVSRDADAATELMRALGDALPN